jgi:diacylglycerol kinase (ATP)
LHQIHTLGYTALKHTYYLEKQRGQERRDNMAQPKKAIVIYSPYSGRSDLLDHTLTQLQQAGTDITDIISIASLDGRPIQGAEWRKQGIDLVIAAGGDGLVGGVITHIAECGLPLGILPLGTSNDVARSLSIPQDILQAVEVLTRGRQRIIDIGVVQPAEQAPHAGSDKQEKQTRARLSPGQHGYFAHALTLGLNVEFARQATNIVTRQRFGRLTYPFAALEVLKNHHTLNIKLRLEGLVVPSQTIEHHPARTDEGTSITYHGNVLQVSVINAPIVGGTWQLAIPGASIDDHLLDIIIIEDVDLVQLSGEIAQLLRRPAAQPSQEHHLSMLEKAELTGIPGVHHIRARAFAISTTDDPQDITLDGEIRSQTPAYVRMADKQLAVFTRE